MNTPSSKKPLRYDPTRFPRNSELKENAYALGVEDNQILTKLGQLAASWPHVEEDMITILATLMGADQKTPVREIFRSIIAQEAKIKMMRHLLEETEANTHRGPHFDKIIKEFAALNALRNKYIHGLWFNADGETFLSTTDPAHHPFFTTTRKIEASELEIFLSRCLNLKSAINAVRFLEIDAPLDERYKERLERLLAEMP